MDFTALVRDLGITAACLVALGISVWRALIWVANNVAKPVIDRHVRFLDELSGNFRDLCEVAMANQQAIKAIVVELEEHRRRYDEDQRAWRERWDRMERPK